jgi:hypothetical protein
MSTPFTNLAPAILFNEARKVVSSSPYATTWPEMKARFVFNEYRAHLAARFEAWVHDASRVVAPEFIWIGGSFASDKPEPADVDAVMFYRYRTFMPNPTDRDAFLTAHAGILSSEGAKSGYQVDGATVALTLPVNQLIHLAAYWAMVWSNGADGTRRAFYTLPAASFSETSNACV